MKKTLILISLAICSITLFAQQENDILGYWMNEEGDAKIQINKKLIITTGISSPNILNDIIINISLSPRVKVYKELDFFNLENLVSKCKLLISCHGSVSHIAAAHQIKQIDIIDKMKLNFYAKWTAHFRNYSPIYRKKFSELSKEITRLL